MTRLLSFEIVQVVLKLKTAIHRKAITFNDSNLGNFLRALWNTQQLTLTLLTELRTESCRIFHKNILQP
ncbi:CLUMA_CG020723, isoform A [Clunio marinus]|uniref:CLUMA_CG020723, isoform A n=1 Tax=Clunio marinus TaxID=568069 RepID=A0A1J1J9S4_9DIPT|nr:CLUMA_CG020723, isoform A [Clunio marinus]